MYDLINSKLLVLHKNEFEQIIQFCNNNNIKLEYFIKKLFNFIISFELYVCVKYIIISYCNDSYNNLLYHTEELLINHIEQLIILSGSSNINVNLINLFIELNNYESQNILNCFCEQDLYLIDVNDRISDLSNNSIDTNKCICSDNIIIEEENYIEETELLVEDLENMCL
jgi:hypothetical protein